MIEKIWKDPVWSKLIVMLFVAVTGLISNHYIDWWNSCKVFMTNTLIYLGETSKIQNWLLILISLIASIFILLIILIFIIKLKKPSPSNYVSDTFFNIKWHWKNDTFMWGNEPIYNLYTLCSNCEYQIYPKETLDAYSNRQYKTSFYCENCDTQYESIPLSNDALIHKIKLKIQHKLRTNTWNQ